jgi:hypothetical protein
MSTAWIVAVSLLFVCFGALAVIVVVRLSRLTALALHWERSINAIQQKLVEMEGAQNDASSCVVQQVIRESKEVLQSVVQSELRVVQSELQAVQSELKRNSDFQVVATVKGEIRKGFDAVIHKQDAWQKGLIDSATSELSQAGIALKQVTFNGLVADIPEKLKEDIRLAIAASVEEGRVHFSKAIAELQMEKPAEALIQTLSSAIKGRVPSPSVRTCYATECRYNDYSEDRILRTMVDEHKQLRA